MNRNQKDEATEQKPCFELCVHQFGSSSVFAVTISSGGMSYHIAGPKMCATEAWRKVEQTEIDEADAHVIRRYLEGAGL